MRQFLRTALLTAAGLLLVVSASSAQQAVKAKKPNVDLVICLDTSGSMNGLIESAKVKLWDIVNELGKAKPAPNLRIALFTYGSPTYGQQSGFVRKNLDFTTDLDMVYKKLFALRTNGGTEYVARVTQAAIDQLKWSKEKNALRLIFVCGNERANQDPMIKLQDVAKNAVTRDIIVNTIYCRWNQTNTTEVKTWQILSSLAEGRFVSIDQNRGAVAVNTPHDSKLQKLGVQLNKTYVWYGKLGDNRRRNQLAQDKNAEKLGKAVAAGRAASKAGYFYRQAEACLVDRCIADPKFDISTVEAKDLPDHLKKMTVKQRVAYVNEMKNKRVALQKEIAELNKQRQTYIRNYQKKNQSTAQRAFDDAIRTTLQTQAQRKGIQIQK